jgi:hypothetical protein
MKRPRQQMARFVLALLFLASAPWLSAQSGSVASWKASAVWRVDGTEAGEPFFDLRDFVVAKDGGLWALDFKDQTIRRFDGGGKPLSNVSRKGSGPGELSNANGLVILDDGTVWANDPRNGRLTVFGADGKFLRQHTLAIRGYGWRWEAWLDRTSNMLVDQFINQRPGGSSSMEWRHIGRDGAIRDTFPLPTCMSGTAPVYSGFQAETKGKGNMYRQYPFANGGGLAADGRGGAWCAVPGSARVALVRIGKNDTIAQTTLPLAPIPVTKVERDEAIAEILKSVSTYATNNFDASKIPSAKPPIARLSVDDEGRLWVQHTARHGDTSVTFDVHDRTGKHLGRVRFPQRPASSGLPVRARGNDVWIALMDADDVVGIARYRLSR